MTTDVLRELRKKRRLWKKTKNGGSKEEYEAAAKKVKNLIRSAKRNMEKKLASEKSGNKKTVLQLRQEENQDQGWDRPNHQGEWRDGHRGEGVG